MRQDLVCFSVEGLIKFSESTIMHGWQLRRTKFLLTLTSPLVMRVQFSTGPYWKEMFYKLFCLSIFMFRIFTTEEFDSEFDNLDNSIQKKSG